MSVIKKGSRRSSRPTSTTQRRQNLLRSVTEVRSGRMTTNGLFRLGSQTMTEVNRRTGRARLGSYFIVRNDLAMILNALQQNTEAFFPITTYYTAGTDKTAFRVLLSDEGAVYIGCKVFTGKDAAALKQWALPS